jgi:P27 family predicted phage terminase small subunit
VYNNDSKGETHMGGVGSGRRPRSTHLKALEGVAESRLNRHQPIPADGQIVPPVPMGECATAIWRDLITDLVDKKVVTIWDVYRFASYCIWSGHFFEAESRVQAAGPSVDRRNGAVPSPDVRLMNMASEQMGKIGAEFGLSPATREQLRTGASS